MKTPHLLSIGSALALLAAPSARPETVEKPAGGFDPAPFPHIREIGRTASLSGFYRFEADADLYRHSGRDFEGFRIAKRDADGWIELPRVVRRFPSPPTPDRGILDHRVESLKETAAGDLEIEVSLGKAPTDRLRLEIVTPLRDFVKGVTIAVPGPGGAWTDIVADGVIFDHSRFLDFRHTTLDLPKNGSRRYLIRISDANDVQRSRVREITKTVGDASGVSVTESSRIEERNFRIDRLRFLPVPRRASTLPSAREARELSLLEEETGTDGTTLVVFECGDQPLDRLEIVTPDRNFRRPVFVEVPYGNDGWRTIGKGYLHRYEVGGLREESLILSLPETRAERMRLRIENGRNTPVNITEVHGIGPAYEVFFLADAGEEVSLFLGNPDPSVAAASLDTAAIQAALNRKVPPATLIPGTLLANPAHLPVKEKPEGPGPLDSKPALWVIIALAVAVLIGVLYQALWKIEENTERED